MITSVVILATQRNNLKMKLRLTVFLVLLVIELILSSPSRRFDGVAFEKFLIKARDVLDRVPLIDGHNDFPYSLRRYESNQVGDLDIYDLTTVEPWASSSSSHTDINRLRQGKVGAQFWSAYVPCSTQYKDAISKTWEQIDVIHRLVEANPTTFAFVTSAQEIEDAFAQGKIGSMVGVEGGHSIGSSLAVLRMMYDMGVRYMTMTHSCPTPWADNSQLDDPGNVPVHDGLTPFGRTVVAEMNRLGMLIDLSHVSRKTMRDALEISTAPVIFSHSSAYALCNNTRNVPDDILQLVAQNGGVVMVNFFVSYVTCGSDSTVQDVADHIEHIRNIAGVDNVGVGSDFNGVARTPDGLKDVSQYPNLFAELLARGWTETDLEKVAGLNLLRALRGAESVRDQMAADGIKPFDEWIPQTDLPAEAQPCSTGEYKSQKLLTE
ncbi:LOW QUALITY PROTEIN: dipeptidase 1 [Daphnia magna]|uniref:LOW QUALITY PROTEIN: dipeptidase 1 n=1 Tax=Daphnia magna TaxID=35525 RepID=UPI001E1BB249|nr:LOW QUALITY PROTEIN: dipeptidase 1 [Daphnia magna]